MIWILVLAVLGIVAGSALLRLGSRWGSTPEERTREMPGDEFFQTGRRGRVVMTRAISIAASPQSVWPWIAQLGRGAGWYSIDRLDNGGKSSARHIVSWIPDPRLGDATTIGYLRHLDSGRSLAWWVDGVRFAGSRARLVTCFSLRPEGQGTRLVSRMSADAAGLSAGPALWLFRIIDSIMATRQLIGIRHRVEYGEANLESPRDPETGMRDQYQAYEVLYASGERAGIEGKDDAAQWRQSAIEDGILFS